MNPEYVIALTDPQATLAVAGGKGASLARLSAAGLPVPGGFHVTTTPYRQFVAENNLQPRILAALEAVDVAQPSTLETASRAIQALFSQAHVPPAIAGTIAHACADLPGDEPAVAVRSSATAEDLPDLSFAGQQETYLNVRGAAAVLDAVKRCWASLWTARAIGYRTRNSISSADGALAVVVQKMIASEVSGVLFTVNPVTGVRDEIVIEASWSLGEAVVSGQVDPDNFVVDTRAWRITERIIGSKSLAIIPREGGGTVQVARDATQRQALPDAQIVELARLAQCVAEHFGLPQDVEWAWANQQFYILQSRPVTTL